MNTDTDTTDYARRTPDGVRLAGSSPMPHRIPTPLQAGEAAIQREAAQRIARRRDAARAADRRAQEDAQATRGVIRAALSSVLILLLFTAAYLAWSWLCLCIVTIQARGGVAFWQVFAAALVACLLLWGGFEGVYRCAAFGEWGRRYGRRVLGRRARQR